MTEKQTEKHDDGVPATPAQPSPPPSVSAHRPACDRSALLRRRLLAGAAAVALIAGTLVAATAGVGIAGSAPDIFAQGAAARAPVASVAVPDFGPLVDAVKPAVVSVRVKSRMASNAFTAPQGNPFEGTPFEKFFRQFGQPNGNGAPGQIMRAQGSGFFISPDGYIVTNNHVVDHAVDVQVVMDDGTELQAKVVGTDKRTDLALLKVSGRSDLPFGKLATKSPHIGAWVVAMGNPFGLGGTVTAGIVSAKGRDIGNGPYDDYIQIDAPVNKGNSGGPSFDMNGEVIGVNTAIFSPSGGSVGIAFDIPAATVRTVVAQLRQSGHVERGWLGVEIQPVTRAIADSLGLKSAAGALISEPQPDSPAAKAGLKSGDIISKVNGEDIKDARDLARRIAAIAPHAEVTLQIERNGKPQDVKITLGEFKDKINRTADDTGQANPDMGKLGLTVAPAETVEGAGDHGLAVLGVDPNGQAAELGIQSGDVILKAGGAPIASAGDLKQALAKARGAGKRHALALVRHDNAEHYVALPVG